MRGLAGQSYGGKQEACKVFSIVKELRQAHKSRISPDGEVITGRSLAFTTADSGFQVKEKWTSFNFEHLHGLKRGHPPEGFHKMTFV